MARVSVEQSALTDARFRTLGALAISKLPDKEISHAVGIFMSMLVWNHCQETERYKLPAAEIDEFCEGLSDFMVEAKLGKKRVNGFVYVCGTRGRIEWLKNRRKEGREGGKKGGRPRKSTETRRGLPGNTPLTPTLTPAPTTEKEKTLIPSSAAASDAVCGGNSGKPKTLKPASQTPYTREFLEFWAAYPRKIGKGAAWKAWKQRKDRPKNGDMLASVEAHKQSEQWTKECGRYIPHPATFLNQSRWEDEPDAGDREVWI